MSDNKQNKDGDGKSAPQTQKTDGNGHDRPGLIIDVVLPKRSPEKSEPERKAH